MIQNTYFRSFKILILGFMVLGLQSCSGEFIAVPQNICSGEVSAHPKELTCFKGSRGKPGWKSQLGLEFNPISLEVRNAPKAINVEGFILTIHEEPKLNTELKFSPTVGGKLGSGEIVSAIIQSKSFPEPMKKASGWVKFFRFPSKDAREISFEFDLETTDSKIHYKGIAFGNLGAKNTSLSNFGIPPNLKKKYGFHEGMQTSGKEKSKKGNKEADPDKSENLGEKKSIKTASVVKQDAVDNTRKRKCIDIINRDYSNVGASTEAGRYFFLSKESEKQSKPTLFEYNVEKNKIVPILSVTLGNKNFLNIDDKGAGIYTFSGWEGHCGKGKATGILFSLLEKTQPFLLKGNISLGQYFEPGLYVDNKKNYLYYLDPTTKQKRTLNKSEKWGLVLSYNPREKSSTYLRKSQKANPPDFLFKKFENGKSYTNDIFQNQQVVLAKNNTFYKITKYVEENKIGFRKLDAELKASKEIIIDLPNGIQSHEISILPLPKFNRFIITGRNQYINKKLGALYYVNLHSKTIKLTKTPQPYVIGKVLSSPNEKFLVTELLDESNLGFVGAGIVDLKKSRYIKISKLNYSVKNKSH